MLLPKQFYLGMGKESYNLPILMKPPVVQNNIATLGFNLYDRGKHFVSLGLLGEYMHKGQRLFGCSCHSVNCSFTIIIQSELMPTDRAHRPAWLVCPFTSWGMPHPHGFLKCLYWNNLGVHEQTNEQTNELKKRV